ncbi:ABC transporter ATP-binding protein [Roseiarcaceae bacterium H3SJ34-1]|uniref:ABC transporter ATP-binding protein n=1 Tax=Terripilifer ovatus TaxID=3032367 RepID=UPI003AB9394C|nr:ABC transporter ATP-binding protein [Roseiarcaceae bacterium H3SJ34-1]
MLELKGVSAGYGPVEILRDVSLQVGEAEVVALVGPNGAGKTTLLKTISGLIRATAGNVVYDGQDLTRASAAVIVGAGIAHCPEERKVWSHMSVEENLELGAYLVRDRGAVRRSLQDIYGEFPVLEERRTELAGRLSGGQQQMLAVGRALMSQPKLVLFDEPSLGLSPILIRQIATIVERIHQRGIAVLLVEQNVDLALRLANRAYVLGSGKVVAEDKASSLRANPSLLKAYLG